MSRLYTDCLDEIFKYLEDDGNTLYSCLLVNRLWCVVCQNLWRSIRNYHILITRPLNELKKDIY
jgi:hypothetical protein